MIFRHPFLLLGLVALAVPIIVHLLNRRWAKIVHWGAMHFLMGSLVSRKRHVMLEDVMLLALRCLLVALLVLIFARPVITAGSSIAWAILLPMVLASALALGAGTALWQYRRWRYWIFGSGLGLLLLAVVAVVIGDRLQLDLKVAAARDVAIVIDASDSMSLKVGDKSNFDRAVADARRLVETLGRGSTVSIVLAGPLPDIKTPFPLTDADRISAVLQEAKLIGGTAAMTDAFEAAAAMLSRGSNSTRSIVLFTDGQSAGWSMDDLARWRLTANTLRSSAGSEPEIICRTLDVPDEFRNLAVTEVSVGRKVVGTDRPLPIWAAISNTGHGPVPASSAYLYVDGKQIDRRPVTELSPGGSQTVSFSHRFEKSGFHGFEVRLDVDDDLPADNHRLQAIHVRQRLGVLIIDGRPDARRLDRAAAFIQLALDPASIARQPRESAETPKAGGESGAFLEVTVVSALESTAIDDFGKYHVVVLADVPQLPSQAASRLSAFVAGGGGLLIAPGARARAAFYNAWAGPDQKPIVPAKLGETVSAAEEPVPLAIKTVAHPALASMLESGKHDLATAEWYQYWQLQPRENKQVLVGANLGSGDPLLVESPVGKGRVLMTAASLDLRSGNLPTCRAFLPLIHALVNHLAGAAQTELNHLPDRELTLRLGEIAELLGPGEPWAAVAEGEHSLNAEAKAPDGSAVEARGVVKDGQLSLQVDRAALPGLYEVKLAPPAGAAKTAYAMSFAVLPEAGESDLQALSDGEWKSLESILHLQRYDDLAGVSAAVTSGGSGRELWQYLALAAFLVVLAEVAAANWIARQRRPTTTENVDFAVANTRVSSAESWARMRAEASANAPQMQP